MKYISSQPANNYFVWQLEVFDHQFKKLGYDLNDSIHILVNTDPFLTDNVKKYLEKNKGRVFLVPDERKDKFYLPAIKIHGLYQYFKTNTIQERLFLHDSDIVFLEKFDWDSVAINDKTAYCSDTISYTGAVYSDSKSPILTNKMCEIVGIDPSIVRSKQDKSGGAQWILPTGLTAEFWNKVEHDSNRLYAFTSSQEGRSYKKPEDPYPFQSWQSEMNSLLWNVWYAGYDTEVIPEMHFSWASWPRKRYEKTKIIHMAGVVNDSDGLFFKGKYINKMPFGEDMSYAHKTDTASSFYINLINEVSEFYK